MKRPRDSQRSRLYFAERTLPEFRNMDLGREVSVAKMQAFVDGVTTNRRVVKEYGPHSITAEHSQGAGGACAIGSRKIKVSGYYRTRLIILHELAHCYNFRRNGGAVAAHGWEYAEIYLRLVEVVMGRAVAGRLKSAFKAGKVRFRRKRYVSPAQAKQMALRLKIYRIKRQGIIRDSARGAAAVAACQAPTSEVNSGTE